MTCIRQPQGPLGAPHHWPRTLGSQSHPFGFSTHVLLISSFPTVLMLPSLPSEFLALITLVTGSSLSPPINASGPAALVHQPVCSLRP